MWKTHLVLSCMTRCFSKSEIKRQQQAKRFALRKVGQGGSYQWLVGSQHALTIMP